MDGLSQQMVLTVHEHLYFTFRGGMITVGGCVGYIDAVIHR